MIFRNFTPFPPLYFESRDEKQQDFGVVVLRGTFLIQNGQRLRMTQQQDPINYADEYIGDPQLSSLKREGCLVPFKPSTDIFFTGNAHAPSGKAETTWSAAIKFGQIAKRIYVTGPRCWERRFGLYHLSTCESVYQVPILYEFAYGGNYVDKHGEKHVWPANPVGCGFVNGSENPVVRAPQIFNSEVDSRNLTYGVPLTTAGLGPVAPHWAPRCDRVGTYNEMWKRTRFPDLPEDFSFSFYSSAAAGLTMNGFAKGDEVVELTNLTSSRRTVFQLPSFQLASLMRFNSGAIIPGPVMLDTVHIDAQEMKVHLSWRTVYPINSGLRALEIRAKDTQSQLTRSA